MKIIIGKVGKDSYQARVTIPKPLFQATGWKAGDIVEWEILGRNKLKLEKVKE